MNRRTFLTAISAAPILPAQDWPQWRGPNRDGAAPSSSATLTWPEKLKPVWKVTVGEGHSSPVVAGGRVYQFARRANDEVAAAFDLATGKKLWEHAEPAPYEINPAANGHGKGPKATPVVAGGKLYTFGIAGALSCLDAASGSQLWRYDSAGKWKVTSPTFGAAASPILHGSSLIAWVGTDKDGALVALDANTGGSRWQWKGEGPGYSSPVIVKVGATTQLVTFSSEKFLAVNADNGNLLWTRPFTTPYTQNSVTPFVLGDTVFYSGLSNPLTAARITASGIETRWENKDGGMYMSSPVLAAGLLHGLSNRNKGMYVSIDPQSGKTVWTSDGRRAENAMLISRGDMVFSLTTDSELDVMKASPKGLEPIRKYTVANSPTWAHPVVLGSRILVKDKDSLALWTA